MAEPEKKDGKETPPAKPAVHDQLRALKGTVTTFDQMLEELATINEGMR